MPHLRAIEPAFLRFTVTGPDGTPATFTPWYGALAHAIFFRKGSLDYFHTHVCAPGRVGCTSALGGDEGDRHVGDAGQADGRRARAASRERGGCFSSAASTVAC